MIHIAPCSCELHVRIRELEAALKAVHLLGQELGARAEKAEAAARAEASAAQVHFEARQRLHFEARQRLEARVAELEAELALERDTGSHDDLCPYKARVEKAEAAARAEASAAQVHFEARQRLEARVAELEAEAWDAHMEHGPGRHCRRCVEPAPAIEGHEREEC